MRQAKTYRMFPSLRILVFAILAIIIIPSCSKEEFPRVEYRVSSSSGALISYTMKTPTLRQEQVSGSWSVSFRHEQGAPVFLSAVNGFFGNTTISVYVNKELTFTQSTNTPGQVITISEFLP